jgi:hypothetical protein
MVWRKLGGLPVVGILVSAITIAGGCGDEQGRDNDSAAFTSITASGSGTGIDDDTGEDVLDLGGGSSDTQSGPANECETLVDEADIGPRPQDIIFAVDTSGSMIQEAQFVQEQMNSFSIQIEAANVDARIILLAEYPPIFGPGVCIDPPLGSGGCPGADSNPPKFLHVPDSDISSSNSLQQLLDLYDGYSPFLRPNAVTHVVVVSDDNSALLAPDFTSQFITKDPHLVDFVFHGIVSSEDPDEACGTGSPCCQLAAERGTVYQELIDQTGGVEGNLCEQQFQPVFSAVAQQVVAGATLSCSYPIPAPPEGEEFDKDQVNVSFDDGDGNFLDIGRVDDPSMCGSVEDGWYYDDPSDPTLIQVCPQTCDQLQGFTEGSVAIKFGCATIPAG